MKWIEDNEIIEAAKKRIADEFMSRYAEWLKDVETMSAHDYGWKYGWEKPEIEIKDSLKTIVTFQKYIFSGRWLPEWEKVGIDRLVIFDLADEGFLSLLHYYNWNARASGRTDFYYINQANAKRIYKEYKANA